MRRPRSSISPFKVPVRLPGPFGHAMKRPTASVLCYLVWLVGTAIGPCYAQGAVDFRFVPTSKQPLSAPVYLKLLDDPELARMVLSQGAWLKDKRGNYWVKTLIRNKPTEPAVMFRLKVSYRDLPPVEVFFKPRQARYRDWATETVVCRLARELQVEIAPCFERVIARRVLAKAVAKLPAHHRDRLKWEGKDGARIFGFFRVWAPAYRRGLGRFEPNSENMLRLVSQLRGGATSRGPSALLKRVSDIIVLDYLIYNNDRRNNLGALRGANGLRLFAIDFGDGLSSSPKRKQFFHKLFLRLRWFRQRLIQRIKSLDRGRVEQLVRGPQGTPLVRPRHVEQLLAQQQKLLGHVKQVVSEDGPKALF